MPPVRSATGSLVVAALLAVAPLGAQWSRADSLRGAPDSPGRGWWDVTHYDLDVRIQPADSTVRGSTRIAFRVVRPATDWQVDLQAPLVIDSVLQDGRRLAWRDEGAAHFVAGVSGMVGTVQAVTVFYSGRPRVAPRPPWDGGFTWTTDSLGRPWIVTTDQGIGASVWWPNKDTQADEPDSMRVTVAVPTSVGAHVGAGHLAAADTTAGWLRRTWVVHNPINNYAIAIAAGHYAHWQEVLDGEAGPLTMDFFPLDYHEAAARRQWVQARTTLQCFEHWFGPYPWYADGYKLIEVPNNGMEHQSAVTYGNLFANGYRRRDGSGTGLGLQWDFIIVHESAHEWWGNNLTTADLADMWVHESFANYAENLYTECRFGTAAGARYVIGTRQGIRNDRPIIPAAYGVNAQGSGDMYPKGGNMLHTIRQIVADDDRWRQILRGLQSTYRHQIVTGQQVQDYISREAGIDLSRVFAQYLTTTDIPVLEWRRVPEGVRYRWSGVLPGFDMPVDVAVGVGQVVRLRPTTAWQGQALPAEASFVVDEDFYVTSRELP